MPVTDAPTSEVGYATAVSPAYGPTGGGVGGFIVDGIELNPALQFPASAVIYDRMRTEDGQIGSVLRALVQPLLRTRWYLDGGGPAPEPGRPAPEAAPGQVRPEVMALVERNLGLGATATTRRRGYGIDWHEHLRHALLCLPFGFMPFEQVYAVGPTDIPGLGTPGQLYAHLGKLAPRMPRTLSDVIVDKAGGLQAVVQNPPAGAGGATLLEGVRIPADRLVMYVNDREGGEWTGRSVLRQAYKHWLIKDVLLQLSAQVVERNGMGIPVVTYPADGDRATALKLAADLRAGSQAGAALQEGWSVSILGVSGSTADPLPLINYHDQAVSRSLLAMFLDLGHDNGARSLGDSFVDVFLDAEHGFGNLIASTTTEHVIRDLVELNFGPDEPYPTLRFDPLSSDSEATAESLKALAEAGLLKVDAPLRSDVRRRFGLPAEPAPEPDATDEADPALASVGLPALIAAGIMTRDEARGLLGLGGAAPAAQPLALGPAPAQLSGDDRLDRVAALVERIAALQAVHGVPGLR